VVYHRRTDECFQWHHTYGVSVNIKQTGGGSWEWNVKENFTGATVDTKLGFQEGSLVIAHGKAKTYDLAAAEARASVENLDNNITDKKLHTIEVKRPMHTFCTSTVSSSPANICEFAGGYGYVHQFIKPDASDAKYYIVLKDLSVEPNFNETTKFTQGSAYTHFIRYIEET
tara:strand:+ start:109 stop:621 length:513 start_codon:yes stop_codon:yes gene_type:complete